MTRIIPVSPFDYVVFGGSGDLARRKLLPALFRRFADGQFDANSRVIGVSRGEVSQEEYRATAAKALSDHIPEAERPADLVDSFLRCVDHVALDVSSDEGWPRLAAALRDDTDRTRVFYLAVAPDLYGQICVGLGCAGLATPRSRVVLEKPLGYDLASAEAINGVVAGVFDEGQIYRIDHYLGKETVQNLMALRFANALFEPVWNSAHIDHVQITVAESIGMAGRANYYDRAGALRDMVQNHLLQLLCLVAIEPPASSAADALRDEKLKVLHALKPIEDDAANRLTVRGQYRAVEADKVSVPGYVDELGRPSNTETFVAIKAEVANWRWAGTPFYLRTGKRMARRVSEIVIQFRDIPHSMFELSAGRIVANRLVLRLQPDEAVQLFLMIKDPGPGGMRLRQVPLNLSFAETFGVRQPDAYERLLLDVVRGNQSLFMRRDEVAAAWSWIDPIRDSWERLGEPLHGYIGGTWGPSASIALMERDHRSWHDDGT
ncbi:glucose-6-phosphate dehydrogenase [Rhodoligotrophos defluvii]|uniref:glucose-6-phosphate dehydrogenase n=1 Tax=Rhodoligotrophos defluvii TaxID=2561934 RepID=UPI0010C96749|nr:glucose-6-phosphate dehydrogenase [Rhodoligotrophos defluvii]